MDRTKDEWAAINTDPQGYVLYDQSEEDEQPAAESSPATKLALIGRWAAIIPSS